MGLFKKKKKQPAVATDNSLHPSFGKETPQEFYLSCVQDYHETALKKGYIKKEMIFVPELLKYGQDAILWFLKNEEIQKQISDPAQYYYLAVYTAIRCGILFGLKWHLDFEGLKAPGYVNSVMEVGAIVQSVGIVKKDLGMDENEFGVICQEILLRWMEMHKPYWQLNDPREYTFNAILAVYQLGVTMILEKYGF